MQPLLLFMSFHHLLHLFASVHCTVLVAPGASSLSAVNHDEFPMRATRPMYSVLGHDDLVSHGIMPMQDWKRGLADYLPLFRNVPAEVESK